MKNKSVTLRFPHNQAIDNLYVENIYIQMIKNIDNAIIGQIQDYAIKNGITEAHLLDGNFIVQAIKEKMEREGID